MNVEIKKLDKAYDDMEDTLKSERTAAIGRVKTIFHASGMDKVEID
jgi:hypothetical protein